MAHDLKDVLRSYGAAWSEPDADARAALLAACWSETGVYSDPNGIVEGQQALSDLIGGLHEQMPGAAIELTSGVSEHHSRIHFAWRLLAADGTVAIEGVDFGRLAEDGRLAEITGFFGPPPAA